MTSPHTSSIDARAFGLVFSRHYPVVVRLLQRVTRDRCEAEDLAQEVFVSFLGQQRGPSNPDEIRRWLLRVALNRGLNALRGRRRRTAREDAMTQTAAGDLTDDVERRAAREEVRQVLASLEPRAAKLLMLRQIGLSYAELADVVDVAPGSIGTLLVRAQRAFVVAHRQKFGPVALDSPRGGQR